MPSIEPEIQNPIQESFNRCLDAYNQICAKLPPNPTPAQDWQNHKEACDAFLSALPVLFNPESFQAYLACISKAVTLGAIDPIDIGRYCHMVHTAIAVWKLAHPPVPQQREKAREKQTPLPTKSNHNQCYSHEEVAALLPDKKTQNQLMKQLAQRGFPVPPEVSLRQDPLVALRLIDLARNQPEAIAAFAAIYTPPGTDDLLSQALNEQNSGVPAD